MLHPASEIIGEKYQIIRLLGKGAFGEVYLATHLKLNLPRALKILSRSKSGIGSTNFNDYYDRFSQEAQLGARLDNPHIIRVFDFEQIEDELVLVMEFAAGGSLADRMNALQAAGQMMPVAEVIRIGQEVAEGLAAIHARDVVHRDLKPSNILFDREGQAKIADLGLAQIPGGDSMRSQLDSLAPSHPGTPAYMSPEQEKTKAFLKPPSDVYTLGIILCELLTGRNFKSLKPGIKLQTLRPDIPDWLDELLNRMLLEDPSQRPWDGTEVFQILDSERNRTITIEKAQQEAQDNARREAEEKVRQETEDRIRQEIEIRVKKETEEKARLEAEARDSREAKEKVRREEEQKRELIRLENERRARQEAEENARLEAEEKTQREVQKAQEVIHPQVKLRESSNLRGENTVVSSTKDRSKKNKHRNWIPLILVLLGVGVLGWFSWRTLSISLTALDVQAIKTQPVVSTQTQQVSNSNSQDSGTTFRIVSTQVSSRDGMVMVYVPAGNFLMGSDPSIDDETESDEEPQHTVYLDTYWIDQTNVTNRMYALCVQAGFCQEPGNNSSSTRSSYYGNSSYADYPVINVTWTDANTYCQWAGRNLPTEAQWEKAARGMNGNLYPWGNNAPTTDLANFDPGIGDTTKVGSFPAGTSPYGALDMAGNVWDWVADWYSATYYQSSPANNPSGPSSGDYRTLRGGSWFYNATSLRSANRFEDASDNWDGNIGFRCAALP